MSDTPHLQFTGFGLANYRSFDEEGFVVEHIGKINVFIGKNNSGKSNIIRAIRLLKRITAPKMPQGEKSGYDAGLFLKPQIDSHGRHGAPPSVTVDVPLERLAGAAQPLLQRLREQLGRDALRTRWNTQTGKIEHATVLDDIELDELIELHGQLTKRHYGRRPRREEVLSQTSQ